MDRAEGHVSRYARLSKCSSDYAQLQKDLRNRLPFLPSFPKKISKAKMTCLTIKYIDHLERYILDLTNESVGNSQFRTFVRFGDFEDIVKEEMLQDVKTGIEPSMNRENLQTLMNHYDSSRFGTAQQQPLNAARTSTSTNKQPMAPHTTQPIPPVTNQWPLASYDTPHTYPVTVEKPLAPHYTPHSYPVTNQKPLYPHSNPGIYSDPTKNSHNPQYPVTSHPHASHHVHPLSHPPHMSSSLHSRHFAHPYHRRHSMSPYVPNTFNTTSFPVDQSATNAYDNPSAFFSTTHATPSNLPTSQSLHDPNVSATQHFIDFSNQGFSYDLPTFPQKK